MIGGARHGNPIYQVLKFHITGRETVRYRKRTESANPGLIGQGRILKGIVDAITQKQCLGHSASISDQEFTVQLAIASQNLGSMTTDSSKSMAESPIR